MLVLSFLTAWLVNGDFLSFHCIGFDYLCKRGNSSRCCCFTPSPVFAPLALYESHAIGRTYFCVFHDTGHLCIIARPCTNPGGCSLHSTWSNIAACRARISDGVSAAQFNFASRMWCEGTQTPSIFPNGSTSLSA